MLSFERGKFFFRESLFQCVTVYRTVVKISFIVFNPGAGFRLCVCVFWYCDGQYCRFCFRFYACSVAWQTQMIFLHSDYLKEKFTLGYTSDFLNIMDLLIKLKLIFANIIFVTSLVVWKGEIKQHWLNLVSKALFECRGICHLGLLVYGRHIHEVEDIE